MLTKQVVSYFFIGIFCVLLDWSFFYFEIHYLNIGTSKANFISSHLGIISSYFLNRKFNFKVNDYKFLRFISFYLVGFVGYIFGHFFLVLGVLHTSLRPELVKALSYFGIFVIQYSLNKYVTFGVFVQHTTLRSVDFLLSKDLIGLDSQSQPLSDLSEASSIIHGAINRMEFLYKVVFLGLILLYVIIAKIIFFISFGKIEGASIYNLFNSIFPFKLLIKWLRSFYILSLGERFCET